MERHPVILSIAGSDCSGGAGIQADIKTISALGGYAASAITAVTVQNTLGVRAVHVIPPEIVCGQIEAVMIFRSFMSSLSVCGNIHRNISFTIR